MKWVIYTCTILHGYLQCVPCTEVPLYLHNYVMPGVVQCEDHCLTLYAGRRLRILWGKSQAMQAPPTRKDVVDLPPVPGLPECKYKTEV